MNEIAKKILQTLMGQKFADWYNTGKFDDFITGECQIEQSEILQDIIKMFNLENVP